MMKQTATSLWSWLRAHASTINRAFWNLAYAFVLLFMGYQIVKSWREITTYPWQWDYRYILAGIIVYSINLLMTASAWGWIMTRLSGLRDLKAHIGLFCITNLAMRLPTPLPFIGARSEAYSVRGVPRTTTLTAMSLEVTVTIAGAALVGVLTLPFGLPKAFSQYNLWLWLLLAPILVIVLRPAWLFHILQALYSRFKRPYYPAQVSTGQMLTWVGLFILIWMNGGMLYYLLANSIYPLPPEKILAMINVFALSGVVGWLGQLFFFIPNLAIRQVAAAYLLSFFLPWPVAVAVALITRLCIMIFEMLWALSFSLVLRANRPDLNEPIEK